MVKWAQYLGILTASLILSQSVCAQSPGRGALLVSTEALADTTFEETVLLIVHHDDDGTIGIMINRPTTLPPVEVFPDIAGAASYTGNLYFGGPLAPARPFLLSRGAESIRDSSIRIVDDVYLSGDPSVMNTLSENERSDTFSRIYAGSAQWGPGQLRSELEAGAWELVPGSAGLVFSSDPQALWTRIMSAPRGSEIAWLQAD